VSQHCSAALFTALRTRAAYIIRLCAELADGLFFLIGWLRTSSCLDVLCGAGRMADVAGHVSKRPHHNVIHIMTRLAAHSYGIIVYTHFLICAMVGARNACLRTTGRRVLLMLQCKGGQCAPKPASFVLHRC
jgi:hypothetical protein